MLPHCPKCGKTEDVVFVRREAKVMHVPERYVYCCGDCRVPFYMTAERRRELSAQNKVSGA